MFRGRGGRGGRGRGRGGRGGAQPAGNSPSCYGDARYPDDDHHHHQQQYPAAGANYQYTNRSSYNNRAYPQDDTATASRSGLLRRGRGQGQGQDQSKGGPIRRMLGGGKSKSSKQEEQIASTLDSNYYLGGSGSSGHLQSPEMSRPRSHSDLDSPGYPGAQRQQNNPPPPQQQQNRVPPQYNRGPPPQGMPPSYEDSTRDRRQVQPPPAVHEMA